jgi:hypothetical protein
MNDHQISAASSLDISIGSVFQPESQAQIRDWLTHTQTSRQQKEDFLQALLDFEDDCGGFYRDRAFLLAAEYLALCPECRQGDAIVDRLLKLSYAYFRVEKADWCMPPEALVRSARETLRRTDLRRVVPRFEAMIRQTESRGVMLHASRQLLLIQAGNRCAIAAIFCDVQRHSLVRASRQHPVDRGLLQLFNWPQSLWHRGWSYLCEPLDSADAGTQAVFQVLSNFCNPTKYYEISQQFSDLKTIVQLAPSNPMVLIYMLALMSHVYSVAGYEPQEGERWQQPIDDLWKLIHQANPGCVDLLLQSLADWDDIAGDRVIPYWSVLHALGKLGDRSEMLAQGLLTLLLKQNNGKFILLKDIRILIAKVLGILGVLTPELITVLIGLFHDTSDLVDKYLIAVALRKLDNQQGEAIACIQNTLNEFTESQFTSFLGYPVGAYFDCSSTVWQLYGDAFLFEEIYPLAIRTLKAFIQVNPCHHAAISLYQRFEPDSHLLIQVCLLKLRKLADLNKSYSYDLICFLNILPRISRGDQPVIQVIEQLIQTTENLAILVECAKTLLHLETENIVALRVLRKICLMAHDDLAESNDANELQQEIAQVISLLILYDLGDAQDSQALLRCIDNLPNHLIFNLIENLRQVGHCDSILLSRILEILQKNLENEASDALCFWRPPGICDSIVDWLAIFPDQELARVVTDLRHQLDHPRNWIHPTYSAIVWHCAQRIPISTFRQAWHKMS